MKMVKGNETVQLEVKSGVVGRGHDEGCILNAIAFVTHTSSLFVRPPVHVPTLTATPYLAIRITCDLFTYVPHARAKRTCTFTCNISKRQDVISE